MGARRKDVELAREEIQCALWPLVCLSIRSQFLRYYGGWEAPKLLGSYPSWEGDDHLIIAIMAGRVLRRIGT